MRRITGLIQSDGPNVFRRKRDANGIGHHTAPSDGAHDRDHHVSGTYCVSPEFNEFVVVYKARVVRHESLDMDVVDP